MLAGLVLGAVALVTSGLSFFAALATAVAEIAFRLCPSNLHVELDHGAGRSELGSMSLGTGPFSKISFSSSNRRVLISGSRYSKQDRP